MHIHEYLFAAFIVISILLASILMLTITSEPLRVSSEKEILKAIAQRILTQVLLDPGNPIDWGSNVSVSDSNLKSFGLAYQRTEVSPKDAYVLDADKISRLNRENPFYISPTKVRDLLGLSTEYGFTIEILPALDIEVNQVGPNTYRVSVKSIRNISPISGANIAAKMYYIMSSGLIGDYELGIYKTGADGATNINVELLSDKYVMFLVVEYYNIIVPKIVGHNVNWTYITGNILQLYSSPMNISNREVIVSLEDGLYRVKDLPISLSYTGDMNLYNVSIIEPGLMAVLVTTGNDLIVATKMLNSAYGTISFASNSNPLGCVIEETVLVDGFSYIIRLYIWRLVW